MQDKRSMDNGVIEVDLGDIFFELRKNLKLIVGGAVAFAASAAVYSYVIAKPVYQYSAMIRMPAHVSGMQLNTCVEVLKNSIGSGNSLSQISLVNGTFMIRLTYSGNSPSVIKEDCEKSIPVFVDKIGTILKEEESRKFSYDIARSIKNDISKIREKVVLDNASQANVDNQLQAILERVNSIEKNYLSPKVEVIKPESVSNVPVSPNKKKNIIVAMVLGVFVSCSFVIGRFLWRK